MKRILLTLALVPLGLSMTSISLVPEEMGQRTLAQTAPDNTLRDQVQDVLTLLNNRLANAGTAEVSLDNDSQTEAILNFRFSMANGTQSDVNWFDPSTGDTQKDVVISVQPTLKREMAASICGECDTFDITPFMIEASYEELGIREGMTEQEIAERIVSFLRNTKRNQIIAQINQTTQFHIAQAQEERSCRNKDDSELVTCLTNRVKDSTLSQAEKEEAAERLRSALVDTFDADNPRAFERGLRGLRGDRLLRDLREDLEPLTELAELRDDYRDTQRELERDLRTLQREYSRNEMQLRRIEQRAQRTGFYNPWEYQAILWEQSKINWELDQTEFALQSSLDEFQFEAEMAASMAELNRSEYRTVLNSVMGRDGRRMTRSGRGGINPRGRMQRDGRPGQRDLWSSRERRPYNQFRSGAYNNPRGGSMFDRDIPGTPEYRRYGSEFDNYRRYDDFGGNQMGYGSRSRQNYDGFLARMRGQGRYQGGYYQGQPGPFNQNYQQNYQDPLYMQQGSQRGPGRGPRQ